MPLIRAQKETMVSELAQAVGESPITFIFSYSKLTNVNNEELRTKSYSQGGKIRMVANNLLRLVLKKLNLELELPEQPLALAYGFADEVEAAKTLVDFAKQTETLEIVGGWVNGQFFSTSQVKTLASLPDRATLQAQVVGRLAGITQGLVYNLNYPLQKLAFVVKAIEAAKGSE